MEFFAGFKFLSSVEKKKIVRIYIYICVEAKQGHEVIGEKKIGDDK